MTNPKFTEILCSRCGRCMGLSPGIHVVLGALCDDPICQYQEEVTVNERRDAFIVADALAGTPLRLIAVSSGVSRQRVYQVLDAWKKGVL